MVYTSQNGYVAAKNSAGIPGGCVRISPTGNNRASFLVRRDIARAFQYLIDRLDADVEDVDEYRQGDDWSYFFRPIRGASASRLSNHSSGTAIDYNATQHPLGTRAADNWSPLQIRRIQAILAELDGVIRWGGNYTGRGDPMHFEIVKSPGAVKDAVDDLLRPPANRIKISGIYYDDVDEVVLERILAARDASIDGDEAVSRDVWWFQKWLYRVPTKADPSTEYLNARKDGLWGVVTEEASDLFNRERGIKALGPTMETLIALHKAAGSTKPIRKA